ncbi:GntR family transcriptional regulator [Bordetella pertussis]|nr:GntR family transcriptional regulator [Bordetella pertussis]
MDAMTGTSKPNATSGSTLEYVVDTLRQGILSGRLVPGQRLVEADLTRQLGVSRGPVRESFRRLSAEGLVESIPNQTTMVRRYSKAEMLELFEIRAELEALAARRAAECMDNPAAKARFLQAIGPIWDEHSLAAGPSYFDENRRFHQAIADLSANTQLAELIRKLQLPLIMFQLGGAITPQAIQASIDEHRRIAQAIVDGNRRKAAAEVKAHLKRACEMVERMPPDIFRP